MTTGIENYDEVDREKFIAMQAVVKAAQERLRVWRMLLDTEDKDEQVLLRASHSELVAVEDALLDLYEATK